ncbi:DUF1990 domain-containing protein [Deinococcus sp. RM]|uniref:DUF1990 domain-containing protein n=1 Tax=Deinococcus sp. RM TaxID=2316359 RepID=UPI000E68DC0D|nr:DUF1990 domain-containing protein [Deinococcus sp. RM]RIX97312.1 DUF1990 domain-containing protein [Deinococcus sp. RM]
MFQPERSEQEGNGFRAWSWQPGAVPGCQRNKRNPYQVQAGRFSPLALAFCDRVTDVIDEPRRQGFTYATLPGHPEQGAETFLVEWHADDRVTFTVRAVSQPGWPLLRLVRPALAWLQGRATRQYLRAIARVAVAQNA